MKKVALVIAFLLIFTLTACSSKPKPAKPDQSSKTEASEPKETEDNSGGSGSVHESEMPEPKDPDSDYVYEPERDVPEGLPVYPGAVMAFDTEVWSFNEGLHWMWMYEEAGSAKEIYEFFLAEFKKMGFEFEDPFFSEYEVFLHDITETVSLGYSADDTQDLNRLGYMITVNLDAWDKR